MFDSSFYSVIDIWGCNADMEHPGSIEFEFEFLRGGLVWWVDELKDLKPDAVARR